jgi:hypothetical protein
LKLQIDIFLIVATSCEYHGGMKMGGSSVGHPNDLIGGLNGGPISGFPSGERILPNESPSCFPFDG